MARCNRMQRCQAGPFLPLLLSAVALLLLATTASAARTLLSGSGKKIQNALAIFGDSLSDTGNTLRAAGVPNPGLYFKGRYSNGRAWPDYVCGNLSARGEPVTILNFAYGGATACPNEFVAATFPFVKDLGAQVSDYVAKYAKKGPKLLAEGAKAIHLINIGLNDVSLALVAGVLLGDPTPFIQSLAACRIDAARQLVQSGGARLVVILPVGPLQAVPSTPEELRAPIAAFVASINQAMVAQAAVLQAEFNADPALAGAVVLAFEDDGRLEQYILTKPGTCFQLASQFDALTVTPADVTDFCDDANIYSFYDGFHPTTPTHQWIAEESVLPILQALGFP